MWDVELTWFQPQESLLLIGNLHEVAVVWNYDENDEFNLEYELQHINFSSQYPDRRSTFMRMSGICETNVSIKVIMTSFFL